MFYTSTGYSPSPIYITYVYVLVTIFAGDRKSEKARAHDSPQDLCVAWLLVFIRYQTAWTKKSSGVFLVFTSGKLHVNLLLC